MSDLAAFIAATTQSKVVKELKEENDRLSAELSKYKSWQSSLQYAKRGGCIEITGEGGSPVYAHGFLHDTEECEYMGEDELSCNLDLTPNTQVMCKISKVMDAEILYQFKTGFGSHWKSIAIMISYGPTELNIEGVGSRAYIRGRFPRQFRDEDIEEVIFEDFTINIAEQGNEDDILLRDHSRMETESET